MNFCIQGNYHPWIENRRIAEPNAIIIQSDPETGNNNKISPSIRRQRRRKYHKSVTCYINKELCETLVNIECKWLSIHPIILLGVLFANRISTISITGHYYFLLDFMSCQLEKSWTSWRRKDTYLLLLDWDMQQCHTA